MAFGTNDARDGKSLLGGKTVKSIKKVPLPKATPVNKLMRGR